MKMNVSIYYYAKIIWSKYIDYFSYDKKIQFLNQQRFFSSNDLFLHLSLWQP